MRLFIAEKPSAAQAIAERLTNPKRKRGYWQTDEAIITYCAGHLYALAQPEAYDKKYKKWVMQDLPIIPSKWEWEENQRAKDLIDNLKYWLGNDSISEVINAGDGDREGQAIVDIPLRMIKNQKNVSRFWVSAQDPNSIDKGLENISSNDTYLNWGYAAMARAYADWLHGINHTRAKTLYANAAGKTGVWPVGRVQTPTLNLVVVRDRLIENFTPIPFFEVFASIQHSNGFFNAKWMPSKENGLDENNRLIDPNIAKELMDKVNGQLGSIAKYEVKPVTAHQPKGFSLTGITSAANEQFGYGAKQVLQICQALYEKHKLTSYPRSDCDYLPESQHQAGQSILDAIASNLPNAQSLAVQADSLIKSPTWNDKKVTAHHAIIPTAYKIDMSALNSEELNVYSLIAQNYIAQFYPTHTYDETTVEAEILGEVFLTKGKVITQNGWKALYPKDTKKEAQELPLMEQGDNALCTDLECKSKKTTPPKRFNEASLQVTMENIHRYVDDEKEKELLKEGDGIGTPATRATIIDELVNRGFLEVQNKNLVSTDKGRELIDEVPNSLKSASITATFESGLTAIQNGMLDMNDFISQQIDFVTTQVNQIKDMTPEQKTAPCPKCEDGDLRRIARKDRSAYFWSCDRWREKPNPCNYSTNDIDGSPAPYIKEPECPECKKGGLRRIERKDKTSHFWSCNRWREGCKFTASDSDGKPVLKN